MEIIKTPLDGCYILKPTIFNDERGSFSEVFNNRVFKNLLEESVNFVQDNQSISARGVLRGLHYQKGGSAQAKLVRVSKGSVQDVVVDIRPNSKSFGKHFSVILSSINNTQLFIPRGFAHGFLALEDDTIFNYKCDNYYDKSSEAGIIYNDKNLNIRWNLNDRLITLSKKDKELPEFENINL